MKEHPGDRFWSGCWSQLKKVKYSTEYLLNILMLDSWPVWLLFAVCTYTAYIFLLSFSAKSRSKTRLRHKLERWSHNAGSCCERLSRRWPQDTHEAWSQLCHSSLEFSDLCKGTKMFCTAGFLVWLIFVVSFYTLCQSPNTLKISFVAQDLSHFALDVTEYFNRMELQNLCELLEQKLKNWAFEMFTKPSDALLQVGFSFRLRNLSSWNQIPCSSTANIRRFWKTALFVTSISSPWATFTVDCVSSRNLMHLNDTGLSIWSCGRD